MGILKYALKMWLKGVKNKTLTILDSVSGSKLASHVKTVRPQYANVHNCALQYASLTSLVLWICSIPVKLTNICCSDQVDIEQIHNDQWRKQRQ